MAELPFHAAIDIGTDALIVVDVQNDFCPGGALPIAGGDDIIPLINHLADCFHHVVLTQDWHAEEHVSFASTHDMGTFDVVELHYGPQVLWPDHCLMDSPGAAFHPHLDVPHAQLVIRKGSHQSIDSYSAFVEADRTTRTGLAGYLHERGVKRVFVVGLAFDFCVRWTALDARAAGFDTTVIEDATRGTAIDGSVTAARQEMEKAGVTLIASADLAHEQSEDLKPIAPA